MKFINETGKICDISVDYNIRNSYLEERIEFLQTYFEHINDVNHSGAAVEKIRKELFRINQILDARQAEKGE